MPDIPVDRKNGPEHPPPPIRGPQQPDRRNSKVPDTHAKQDDRWNQWKAEEEKILREQGVDEETIQKLREYDWDDFNAERRFREHQTSLLDCMELLLEEKETKESQPESVEALLDTVENEELLQILLSTDKKTLQMIVLKMMGYAPKEISHHMELPEQTVYTRLRRLREKIKKSMKFE